MNLNLKVKYSLLGIILLMLDQASKLFMFNLLTSKPFGIIEITPFFNFALVINKGVSFGFLNNISNPHYIISGIVLIIIIFLIWLFLKESMKIKKLALTLLIAGAFGNTIDRFIYGGVVDFLDFHIKHFHYPAFNIADTIIFFGVVILMFPNFISKIFKTI